MTYFAIYLENNFIGFISEESQKDFFIECDPSYKFYDFDWGFETPPMPHDINLENEVIEILK